MTCDKCVSAQYMKHSYYYRWKNTNVEISCCAEHFMEIAEVLNEIQRKESE